MLSHLVALLLSGWTPTADRSGAQPLEAVPRLEMPAVDVAALRAEDALLEADDLPLRYA